MNLSAFGRTPTGSTRARWRPLVVTVLSLGVGLLSGCGEGEEVPTVNFVTMEYTARTATDWKELEKRFNETHKDVQVAVTVVEWGKARLKLRSLMKEKEEEKRPDLATLPASWLLEYYQQGQLARLDDRADEDFLVRFHPSALRTGTVEGHRYGLPFGLSVRFLYVGSKLLSASAVSEEEGPPLAPTTWEELARVARAIQAIPDDVREQNRLPALGYGFGAPLSPEEAPLTFAYFLWTAGGRFLDDSGNVAFDSPEGRQALEFLVELVSSADATNPDPVSYDLDTLEALFRTEKLGMLITGHWLRGALLEPGVRVSFGFRPLPRKAQDATLASCDYVVMFAASPRQQEAWQFVDFIYRPENREDFFDPQAGKSVIPELSASLEAMGAKKFWEDFRSSLEVARFMPLEPDWPEIANLLAEEIAAACAGEKSPAKALTDAAEAAQDLIDARRAGVGAGFAPPGGKDAASSAPTVGRGARAFGGAGVRSWPGPPVGARG